MTPEQIADLDELFQRYGSPSREADFRISGYFSRADTIDTVGRIEREDKAASRMIENLQTKIRQLTAYRASLMERYNFLATAPTVPVIRLKRERRDKAFYILTVYDRNLLDSHEVMRESTRYPGTERHKAINAYNTYIKQHPGIIAEMNIEKSHWER